MEDTAGLGLVELWHGVVGVKPDDQSGDTKRPHTARLGVLLLYPRDVLCDVLYADWVLDGESVGLTLDTGFVNEDTAVSGESSKGNADVVVEHGDFADCPWVLELQG